MSDSAIDDREPGFFYGDMPPIRDVSDAVVGMPPREAIRILRARRAEGKTVSDCAKSDAEGTKADVDVFKERRSSEVGTENGVATRPCRAKDGGLTGARRGHRESRHQTSAARG